MKTGGATIPAGKRDAQAGLTLIEVLVVIAVIGIATGAAMLGLNAADRGARAQAEAVRLSRHLSLAVDEALISGLPLQLNWDERGYSFVQWRAVSRDDPDPGAVAGGWQPAAIAGLAVRHDLREPLVMRMPAGDIGAGQPVIIAASGSGPAREFDFSGNGVPWRVDFDGFTAQAVPRGPS